MLKKTYCSCLGPMLLAVSLLLLGCGRKIQEPTPEPPAPAQSASVPAQPTPPAAPRPVSTVPAANAVDYHSSFVAAQAAAKAQDYTNAVRHLDALRAAPNVTGAQLTQIQDAEARLMRDLAAKAAAGDQNALRQFRELSSRRRRAY